MVCPKCGNVFNAGIFCPECGTKCDTSQSELNNIVNAPEAASNVVDNISKTSDSGSQGETKKRSKAPYIIISIMAAIAVVIIGIFLAGKPIQTADKVVRNGCLGEYTDATVEDVLDCYFKTMTFYTKTSWEAEKDHNGTLVTFRAYDCSLGIDLDTPSISDMEAVIQFIVRDDDLYRVVTFHDDMDSENGGRATDIANALNTAYMTYYYKKKGFSDQDLQRLLSSVDGASVLYGASSSYSGSRKDLCKAFGFDPINMSAWDLLEYYDSLSDSEF